MMRSRKHTSATRRTRAAGAGVLALALLPLGGLAAGAAWANDGIPPGQDVPGEQDIAEIRPGGYRLYTIPEAYELYGETAAIGDGGSIGDVVGTFTNYVHDDEPTLVGPGDDTAAIQAAIDAASEETTGGVVRFAAGHYELGMLLLRSNTRLEIDPDAVLKMTDDVLFNAGRGTTAAESGRVSTVVNVEVTSTKNTQKFTIDMSHKKPNDPAAAFLLAMVRNFAISNFSVQDNYTLLPSVFMVPDSDTFVGAQLVDDVPVRNLSFDRCPDYGVVQNAESFHTHTGYGLSQVFCGSHLNLRDLYAEGGVTLRLEPGSGPDHLNRAGPDVGAMHDIEVSDLTNRGGFTTLYIKPHSKEIRNVRVHNLTGIDSGFTLMVDIGSADLDDPLFGRGHYSDTVVTGNISLKKTVKEEVSHIGFMGTYFVADSVLEKVDRLADFGKDPSGNRWYVTDVIAPVLLASEQSADEVGPYEKGRYQIDLSGANITSNHLPRDDNEPKRDQRILYRSDARNLDGSPATDVIEK
ncbi:glycosyl hydrolase family 28-related protein [Agromyces sp. SYSU T0242]|uniref:glycosyl hydrolase family 28-related protein n=1 Tax=Agromyces litoreus TaxID=3158561 RepID=UPI003392F81B